VGTVAVLGAAVLLAAQPGAAGKTYFTKAGRLKKPEK
jgi:hypothetical protein